MARYLWFGQPTVNELRDQLNTGPVARIEIHGEGDERTITVIPETPEGGRGPAFKPLNESHWCPPDC